MTLQLGILKSKLLKQVADTNTTTPVNILDANIFEYGNNIIANDIIIDVFTKIDNTVPSLNGPSGGFFFDITDGFRLKNNNNKIVYDGYYRLKANVNHHNIGATGWKTNKYYLYYVKIGLPIKLARKGFYIDLNHSILTCIGNDGSMIDTCPNGYYYCDNPCNLIIATNNIITNVLDGTYFISFIDSNIKINNTIYKIKDGIISIYNGYFINLDSNNYYNNQNLLGTCSPGVLIVTNDKILIKSITEWKYIPLLSM